VFVLCCFNEFSNLQGHVRRASNTPPSQNQKGTLRFGASGLTSPTSVSSKPSKSHEYNNPVDDEELPEGALEALEMLNNEKKTAE
jgi:hypothetical protein